MDIDISATWKGSSQGWHIYMDDEQVFFTKDEYQKSMFMAELKAKIKIMQSKEAPTKE